MLALVLSTLLRGAGPSRMLPCACVCLLAKKSKKRKKASSGVTGYWGLQALRMAARCGVLPAETSDVAECRRLALRDGAAVLTERGMALAGLGSTSAGCTLLPAAVWGERLRAYALPTELSIQRLPPSAGAAAGRQVTFESYQGRPKPDLDKMIADVLEGTGGEAKMLAMSSVDQAGGIDYAHTDGWAAAAPGTNPRPDFFFLVCEEWDPTGGESFLVDGQGVFESLPPDVQVRPSF
eukprot:COSAG04_NODE_341_length_16294_cov_8.682618_11_plen_237_part_00